MKFAALDSMRRHCKSRHGVTLPWRQTIRETVIYKSAELDKHEKLDA
jgi:hypothetical protein